MAVYGPFATYGVRPTDLGIGGLGHLGLQLANAWGCKVTAFTSSAGKAEEARGGGAHHVVATHVIDALAQIAGTLDLLLVMVNVSLDWTASPADTPAGSPLEHSARIALYGNGNHAVSSGALGPLSMAARLHFGILCRNETG
jgi:D-arabinose 1-dehydrogenase-like Zn-dependent alcohol dehydrogenase